MILQLLIAWLAARINRHQDHVITYLREENRILKAKLKGRQVQLMDTERRRLAVLAHLIDRKHLKNISTIATPDILQRWYRRLVIPEPSSTHKHKPLGRPRVAAEIEQLVVRMANENPRWGYRRIQGALSNLGYDIDKTTVRHILRRNHIDLAPIRGKAGMSWSQFIKLHKVPWRPVTAWRQSLHPMAWKRLTVRDGEKGSVAIEMVKRRVQTRLERKRTGPEEWLVVTRRPLGDNRTLEARASGDATDQDARYRHHYYLTPTDGCGVAFKEPSLGELARVIKAGACIEASF